MYKLLSSIFFILLFIAVIVAGCVILSSEVKIAALSENEPVFIIDAGHGGADGGAVAADGTQEDNINLDIALKMHEIAKFCGMDTVLTRDSAGISYPAEAKSISQMKIWDQHNRLTLINSTPNAVFVSIHQNFYTAEAPRGPQVFYGKTDGSRALAQILQSNLTQKICPQNRREAAPADNDIYLMQNAACPSVLIECGFLSNPNELTSLKTPSYRLNLAVILMCSCMQYSRGFST